MNLQQLGEALAKGVRDLIGPLEQRLKAVEARALQKGDKGEKGDPGDKGPPGVDGKDGNAPSAEDLQRLFGPRLAAGIEEVRRMGEELVAAIPRPKDGVDGKDGVSPSLEDLEQRFESRFARQAGEAEARVADALKHLAETIQKAIDAIPAPKDGRDGTDGKDGTSPSLDDLENRFSDRFERFAAEWALGMERRAAEVFEKAIAAIQRPKDGRDGKDGRDALPIKSTHLVGRQLSIVYTDDSIVRLKMNHPIYRGIWREGPYEEGDCVTFGGSQWNALQDTSQRPGDGAGDWQLAVKRGRDGRDAK